MVKKNHRSLTPYPQWDDTPSKRKIRIGRFTPPKINIEPQNNGLEDVSPLSRGVNLPGCKSFRMGSFSQGSFFFSNNMFHQQNQDTEKTDLVN